MKTRPSAMPCHSRNTGLRAAENNLCDGSHPQGSRRLADADARREADGYVLPTIGVWAASGHNGKVKFHHRIGKVFKNAGIVMSVTVEGRSHKTPEPQPSPAERVDRQGNTPVEQAEEGRASRRHGEACRQRRLPLPAGTMGARSSHDERGCDRRARGVSSGETGVRGDL